MLISVSDRPIFNSRWVVEYAHRTTWPSLKRQVAKLGFLYPDILVLDTCYQPFWTEVLQPRELLMRVADIPHGFSEHFASAVERSWNGQLRGAGAVVVPSQNVARYVESVGVSATLVPNGVEIEHFQQDSTRPAEYRNARNVIAVYVGAIAKWLDLDMVIRGATRTPMVDYYFVGPLMTQIPSNLPENVHFLGPRPYESISGFYQHADVAIVPFDVRRYRTLIEGVDAIKLYEYLAASLPVVATRWEQSERLSPYVYLTDQSDAEFAAAIVDARTGGAKLVEPEVLQGWSWRARFCQLLEQVELDVLVEGCDQ